MFKPKRSPISRIATDEVLVAHAFDDARPVRDIIMGLGFRFDHVLDCDKVHAALARLLEMGGWRRLGGRLRLNKKTGRIEIHVPKKFTPERPAVRYTNVTLDMNMDQHPQVSGYFPHPTESPSIQSNFEQYLSLLEPEPGVDGNDNPPHTLEDYLTSDHPQISLHTVSFRDATLISLKIPHLTSDIMGIHHLLKNWSLVLSGREDQVQPFGGFRDDILEHVAELPRPLGEGQAETNSPLSNQNLPKSEFRLAKRKQLKGLRMFLFILRVIWASVLGARAVPRVIFLPARAMQLLRDEVKKDLEQHLQRPDHRESSVKDDTVQVPFLSDADILTAWCTKMTLSSRSMAPKTKLSLLPCSRRRQAAIVTMVDIRKRLPSVFGSPSPDQTSSSSPTGNPTPVYIQNLLTNAITHLPVSKIITQPLGLTALTIRQSVHAQLSEEVITGYIRHVITQPGRVAVFASADSILVPVTNWTCARLFEVFDLGAAILDTPKRMRPEESQPGRGRPAAIAPVVFSGNHLEIRNVWGVTGRDAAGNYWLQGTCTEDTWRSIGAEFERLRKLGG